MIIISINLRKDKYRYVHVYAPTKPGTRTTLGMFELGGPTVEDFFYQGIGERTRTPNQSKVR